MREPDQENEVALSAARLAAQRRKSREPAAGHSSTAQWPAAIPFDQPVSYTHLDQQHGQEVEQDHAQGNATGRRVLQDFHVLVAQHVDQVTVVGTCLLSTSRCV